MILPGRIFAAGLLAFLWASPLRPQSNSNALNSADRLWEAGQFDTAVGMYRQIAAGRPSGQAAGRAHIQIGIYLKYQGRWQDAMAEYQQAISASPNTREAHDAKTGIAAIHYFLEDFPKALALYREVLAESRDWDQIKYCSYMIRDAKRRMALQATHARRPQCGQTSLAMACSLMGIKVEPRDIASLLPPGPDGVSMIDLLRAAKAKGLDAQGVLLNLQQLRKSRLPAIAFFKPGHYVVVTRADSRWVDYVDPAEQNTVQRKRPEDFARLWTGHTLLFSQPDRKTVTAFLNEESMRGLKGKVCFCCPPSGLGTQNRNTANDQPMNPECPGMPGLLVNLANLNLVLQDLDFRYTGRGPAVFLQRTYNGDDPRDGPFGRSWTFNYNVSLTESSNGSIDVRKETGTIHHFVRRSDGTYAPPTGVYDTLTKNPDATYSLTAKGTRITEQFNSSGKLIRVADRNGNPAVLAYDAGGRLATVTDAAGRRTAFQYGPNNRIASVTDPAGRIATYEYDANGNLIRTVDPAGIAVTYTYDSASYVTAITTPKGTTKIAYSTGGEGYSIDSVTDPLGNLRTYGTYQSHYTVKVVDENGHATLYDNSYDGETNGITDALGNKTTFSYDYSGNRTGITDATGRAFTLAYDSRGNLTRITDALKNSVALSYDSSDNLVSATDALGNISRYSYDQKANLTGVVDPLNGRVTLAYDSLGQLTRVTDARSNPTAFSYDTNGNVTTITGPIGSTTTYAFDAIGRVVTRTDPKGSTFRYTYDGNDRITAITYPDASTTRFTYECCGAASIASSVKGTAAFEYDALRRLVRYTGADQSAIQYAYDNVGNLITLTYPGGRAVSYQYDDANRLATVTDWLGNATQYSYDGAGRLVSSNTANGPIVLYKYDAAGRLASLFNYNSRGALVAGYNYTLNAAGNMTAAAAYPALLPSFAAADASSAFDADNRILSSGGSSYQHDANGNLTSFSGASGATALTYDQDNMLARFTAPGSDMTFAYDPLGNRTAKTVNGAVTRYVVNPNAPLSQVLAETDAGGNPLAYYVYGLGLVSKITPDGRTYSYYFDRLGNTIALSDVFGNVVNTYAYDPYGNSAAGSDANRFRYLGRWGVQDDGNALLYTRARYYASSTGRFLNPDPLAGGGSRYSYAGGDPVNSIDPVGLQFIRLPPITIPLGRPLPYRPPQNLDDWIEEALKELLPFDPGCLEDPTDPEKCKPKRPEPDSHCKIEGSAEGPERQLRGRPCIFCAAYPDVVPLLDVRFGGPHIIILF